MWFQRISNYFGAYVITEVLRELGADVIDGGNQMEVIDVLDLAEEYGVEDITVSVHNGQAYDYAKLMVDLAEKRGKHYNFYMGGYLLSFLGEDCKEPVDVTKEIQAMGVKTSVSVEDLLEQLAAR